MKKIITTLINAAIIMIATNVYGQNGNAYITDTLFTSSTVTDTLFVKDVIESTGRIKHIGSTVLIGSSNLISDGTGPGLFASGSTGQLAIQAFGDSEHSGDITILDGRGTLNSAITVPIVTSATEATIHEYADGTIIWFNDPNILVGLPLRMITYFGGTWYYLDGTVVNF